MPAKRKVPEELAEAYAEASKCNKCGFCQVACPIYRVTGRESKAARGHNEHLRALAEGDVELTKDMKGPIFECLLCRACVANCFPAAATDEVVIACRTAYIKRFGQPLIQRFMLRHLLKSHARIAAYIKLPMLGKRWGLSGLANRLGILRWFGKRIAQAESLVDYVPKQTFRNQLRSIQLPKPKKAEGRIAYFLGCGYNFALPDVSSASLRILAHLGYDVDVLDNCCCGLPAYVYGDIEGARALAEKNLRTIRMDDYDFMLTECATCSSFLKSYGRLCQSEPAEQMASKTRQLTEFLADTLSKGEHIRRQIQVPVTYHDPCHMSRHQDLTQQPRTVLKALAGNNYRELPEADWCCGAAGTYNIMHYDQSMAVLDRKMANVRATDAKILATACPACIIQLKHGVQRAGLDVAVIHVAELIQQGIGIETASAW